MCIINTGILGFSHTHSLDTAQHIRIHINIKFKHFPPPLVSLFWEILKGVFGCIGVHRVSVFYGILAHNWVLDFQASLFVYSQTPQKSRRKEPINVALFGMGMGINRQKEDDFSLAHTQI